MCYSLVVSVTGGGGVTGGSITGSGAGSCSGGATSTTGFCDVTSSNCFSS